MGALSWLVASYAVDVWTVVHVLSFTVAARLLRRAGVPRGAVLALCLAAGLGWEALEGAVVGPALGYAEPWWNAWLSDPAADLAGAWIGSRR